MVVVTHHAPCFNQTRWTLRSGCRSPVDDGKEPKEDLSPVSANRATTTATSERRDTQVSEEHVLRGGGVTLL